MKSCRYDLLIISDDVVGPRMAGPGIRAWEMARELGRHFKLALAIPDYSFSSSENSFFNHLPFDFYRYSLTDSRLLKDLASGSKIIIIQGYILSKFPFLKAVSRHLIVDLYVPFVLENLFHHQERGLNLDDRRSIHLHDLRVFNEQVRWGDHFLCATPRQRDLLVGALLSLNRITPEVADKSSTLNELLSLVPFGLRQEEFPSLPPPETRRLILRKTFPAIGEKNVVLLWGGVMTNWFDPLSLIQAFAQAVKENPALRLVFLSTTHPNPLLPEFIMAKKAKELARELGLFGQSVFFNETWIEYEERANYFVGADIGVSIHKKHFETEFSFRTRLLDYIKYELPIICTEGDYFASVVEKERVGIVVPSQDIPQLKAAILHLAQDENRREIKARLRQIKPGFYWSRVLEPLVRHCQDVLAGKIPRWSKPAPQELKYILSESKASWWKNLLKRVGGRKLYHLFYTKWGARWRR